MTKTIAIALAVTLATVAAVPAFGQMTKPLGLSLRAGPFFPSASRASDEGKTWFVAGLEYKLGDLNFSGVDAKTSSSYSISLDYYGKGDFRSVPVTLNYVGRTDQFYFSAGAGVAFTRIRTTANQTKSNSEFAYQFSVGYDFVKGTTPVFVEARYYGSAETDLNGFGLLIGTRF